jgi:hypothetical protein
VTVFAAGGILGTLVGIAAKLAWDGLVDKVAGSDVLVTVALIVAVVVLISMTTATTRKVDQLVEKASFSITYCSAENPAALYQLSRDVINRSDPNSEIFAVNSYVEVFKDSNDPADETWQRNYLAAFEKRFETIKYHRLIQVKNGQLKSGLADQLAPAYRDHYKKMATFARENPGSQIKIEEAAAKLPTSFVVVKNKNNNGGRIIWQMNRHDPTADSPDVEPIMGVFLITDPDALLVPRFLQWFYELDRGAQPLTTELLGP